MRVGFYPGSFDPLTNGHAAVLEAACSLVDRLVVGVGVHPTKAPFLATDDRLAMIEEVVRPAAARAGTRVEAVAFSGLAVEAARRHGATILIRGLRDGTDLDYEMQLAGMNGALAPDVHTIYLPAPPHVRHITATLVRQIEAMGGSVEAFVPPAVARRLAARRT